MDADDRLGRLAAADGAGCVGRPAARRVPAPAWLVTSAGHDSFTDEKNGVGECERGDLNPHGGLAHRILNRSGSRASRSFSRPYPWLALAPVGWFAAVAGTITGTKLLVKRRHSERP